MMYLCVLFVPPLYFMTRGKWLPFCLNLALYGLAWIFLITIIGAFFAFILWFLAVGHAGWHLRKELMAEHAEMIADKMAEKMRQEKEPASSKTLVLLALLPLLSVPSCATKVGSVTFPEAAASFTPKSVYAAEYERVWESSANALENNRIGIASSDKAAGNIQTEYIEGPSALIGLGLVGAQSTRYKYNISLRKQSSGEVKVSVLCRIESTIKGTSGASQWTDVSGQNGERVKKLEAWLYQEIEKGLTAQSGKT